jgi:hypothetical protein
VGWLAWLGLRWPLEMMLHTEAHSIRATTGASARRKHGCMMLCILISWSRYKSLVSGLVCGMEEGVADGAGDFASCISHDVCTDRSWRLSLVSSLNHSCIAE